MKVQVNGVNISQAMEQYVSDKFSALHIPDNLINPSFKVKSEKDHENILFLATVNGVSIKSDAKHKDFYTGVDILMDKLKVRFSDLKESKHVLPAKRLAL